MEPKPGMYEHYKGLKCRVTGVAKHSETLEDLVVYEEPSNKLSKLWVRPVAMFLEEVEVEGKKVPRFRYVGPG
ncbi:MAG TPA: DUF1653 domain-containing protein [Candidatus Paceibacterota bacterium]|nr:DUF1653 domain-containing protein [Candidatus Paceibacterota bacterium]